MPDLPPRTGATRTADALHRLVTDQDLWLSTCGADGTPCTIPLSFLWDGEAVYVATLRTNPTGRNVGAGAPARAILGHTRDVVMLDGTMTPLGPIEADERCAVAFAEKTGWDPRGSAGYGFYCLMPERVEAWRELNEHADRLLMTGGRWTS